MLSFARKAPCASRFHARVRRDFGGSTQSDSQQRDENNRKARFYSLTRAGCKELTREECEWRRIAGAIMRVLGPATTKT